MREVLLTKKQVAEVVKLHPEHVMRLAREKKFPAPIKMSDTANGRVRFSRDEVEAWLQAKFDARA